MHHKHCETAKDPHCPSLKGFLWSHCGWLTQRSYFLTRLEHVGRFRAFPELWLCDVFFVDLQQFIMSEAIPQGLVHVLPSFWYKGELLNPVTQLGIIVDRAWCLSLHAMGLINSYCHTSQPSSQPSAVCQGHDSLWVALLNAGEGWHRLHHETPRCAHHGFQRAHKGLDMTYMTICALERLGIVYDVQHGK